MQRCRMSSSASRGPIGVTTCLLAVFFPVYGGGRAFVSFVSWRCRQGVFFGLLQCFNPNLNSMFLFLFRPRAFPFFFCFVHLPERRSRCTSTNCLVQRGVRAERVLSSPPDSVPLHRGQDFVCTGGNRVVKALLISSQGAEQSTQTGRQQPVRTEDGPGQ
jgi:hypothetical protein